MILSVPHSSIGIGKIIAPSERVLAVRHKLLFHSQDPVRTQERVHLRLGGSQVLHRQNEQFQLHVLLMASKNRDRYAGFFSASHRSKVLSCAHCPPQSGFARPSLASAAPGRPLLLLLELTDL